MRYVNPLVVGSSPTPVTRDRTRQDPPRGVQPRRFQGVGTPIIDGGSSVRHPASIRQIPPRAVPSGGQMVGKAIR